jgi:L-asparaginase
MKELIQVFVTGGTFDKEYNFITGELYFQDSHLVDMFEQGRSTLNLNVKTLMMIDSLEMTNLERNVILKNCKNSNSSKLLITHGTDTIVDTAVFLAQSDLPDKTIVLTGAMIPIAFGSSSDGFFNLGSALAFVQLLPPGVYIAMNGRYFNYDNVRKNLDTGYFESIK